MQITVHLRTLTQNILEGSIVHFDSYRILGVKMLHLIKVPSGTVVVTHLFVKKY